MAQNYIGLYFMIDSLEETRHKICFGNLPTRANNFINDGSENSKRLSIKISEEMRLLLSNEYSTFKDAEIHYDRFSNYINHIKYK
ncbi:hypothetical protein [Tenacibaculum maritimum]|uniref:hypothetical protein n=1 Tax=Tenacibaculum maritimum TaxID=107401 RepID=UPI003875E914